MKTLRNSFLCLGVVLLASPILRAQDFSKYRGFSLGASMATVLKQTEKKPADAKVIHARPTLIQADLVAAGRSRRFVTGRADRCFLFCDELRISVPTIPIPRKGSCSGHGEVHLKLAPRS